MYHCLWLRRVCLLLIGDYADEYKDELQNYRAVCCIAHSYIGTGCSSAYAIYLPASDVVSCGATAFLQLST